MEHVFSEISMLIERYGMKEIYFDDALFTIARAKEIANEMLARKINIPWSCWIDRHISYNDLKLLRRSGCSAVKFGIETANPDIERSTGAPGAPRVKPVVPTRCAPVGRRPERPFTHGRSPWSSGFGIGKLLQIDTIIKLIRNCRRLGISTHASFMVGLPSETKETISQTVRFAFSIGLSSCQFTVATPLPGTAFYEQALKNRWLTTGDWSRYESLNSCVVTYPGCTDSDILDAFEAV